MREDLFRPYARRARISCVPIVSPTLISINSHGDHRMFRDVEDAVPYYLVKPKTLHISLQYVHNVYVKCNVIA